MAFLPRFDMIRRRAISLADLVVWLCRVSPGSLTDRVEDRSTGRFSFSRISVIAVGLSNAGRSEIAEKSPNFVGMMTVRMRRGGKYHDLEAKTAPTMEVQNFWDLLDFIRAEFEVPV